MVFTAKKYSKAQWKMATPRCRDCIKNTRKLLCNHCGCLLHKRDFTDTQFRRKPGVRPCISCIEETGGKPLAVRKSLKSQVHELSLRLGLIVERLSPLALERIGLVISKCKLDGGFRLINLRINEAVSNYMGPLPQSKRDNLFLGGVVEWLHEHIEDIVQVGRNGVSMYGVSRSMVE